jgi:hypothetical protein
MSATFNTGVPATPISPPDCRVCGGATRKLFDGPLLAHQVAYFECPHCLYVQTEMPYWLEQAYAQAINRSDTGILRRNARNARLVVRVLGMLGLLSARVVDCAGGYGLLVRMLRDKGVDALWRDRYAENLVARGFEHRGEPAQLATAFEAMEHFVDPAAELDALFALADVVLVSTDLAPNPAPAPGTWWYYGPEHGQHIGFFRLQTLRHLADRAGWHLNSDGRSFHLFSRAPVPAWRWRWARNSMRLAGLTARLNLKSRVWTDHAAMSHVE